MIVIRYLVGGVDKHSRKNLMMLWAMILYIRRSRTARSKDPRHKDDFGKIFVSSKMNTFSKSEAVILPLLF